jgi:hypothetical protein
MFLRVKLNYLLAFILIDEFPYKRYGGVRSKVNSSFDPTDKGIGNVVSKIYSGPILVH